MRTFEEPHNFKVYESDLAASHGVMDNFYTLLEIPKTDAKKLIPAGTYLSNQSLTNKDTHPIFLFFTHNFFLPNIEYRELLLGVPYVKTSKQFNNYQGAYTYMPRLYLDEDIPRVSGNKYFGYEKLSAKIIDDSKGKFKLFTFPDNNYIAGTDLQPNGERCHPTDYTKIDLHAEIFHLPFLTQASRSTNPDIFFENKEDEFLVSWIDYDFNHPDSKLTPIKGNVEIGNLFTPFSLPRGIYHIEEKLGAFRIEVQQKCSSAMPIRYFTGERNWMLAKKLTDNRIKNTL